MIIGTGLSERFGDYLHMALHTSHMGSAFTSHPLQIVKNPRYWRQKLPKTVPRRFPRFDPLVMAKVNRFTFRYNFSGGSETGKTSTRFHEALKSTV